MGGAMPADFTILDVFFLVPLKVASYIKMCCKYEKNFSYLAISSQASSTELLL